MKSTLNLVYDLVARTGTFMAPRIESSMRNMRDFSLPCLVV